MYRKKSFKIYFLLLAFIQLCYLCTESLNKNILRTNFLTNENRCRQKQSDWRLVCGLDG